MDILENDILEQYPSVLELLLLDQTSKNNILWATSNYLEFNEAYTPDSTIQVENITGQNGKLIMPRVKKTSHVQLSRVKEKAEVFTPSWVCNAQNNLVDNAWFARENVFNFEFQDGSQNFWKSNTKKIKFPKEKSWKDYVKSIRLEISCGEAPYLVSRYDTTTGNFIKIWDRIGVLDRKLRVISENCSTTDEWLKYTMIAFQSTYGYEWQGDSLLLARESLLFTFIDFFKEKFKELPPVESIEKISYIVSWNIWQMDGLKGVIPKSCTENIEKITNLFGEKETITHVCEGCKKNDVTRHNGIYANVMDWTQEKNEGEIGKIVRFIDLLEN